MLPKNRSLPRLVAAALFGSAVTLLVITSQQPTKDHITGNSAHVRNKRSVSSDVSDVASLSPPEVVTQLAQLLSPASQRSVCRSTIYPGGRCGCDDISGDDSCGVTPLMDPRTPVCLGKGLLLPGKPCLVYSAGIEAGLSFETELAKFGCTVHVFDPLQQVNASYIPEHVHVHPIGLAGNSHVMSYNNREYDMFSFDDLVQEAGHQRHQIDYLKMNVLDGWGVLLQQSGSGATLRKIPQLAMTLRFPRKVYEGSADKDEPSYGHSLRGYLKQLRALQAAGHQLVLSQPGKEKFDGTNLSHEYRTFWVRKCTAYCR
ncbi:uncharacterized protein LOC122387086 [Amphibalanus amphitrite]|uniref:uncharacterized protein LOC122387086 n=1 Tax=Amphibalanus amphitrite TaxID=1232801 RepID=UPI001C90F6F3|nr:uncharacterized protein LOC122387086 [Amphibalanus amphitrite]